MLLVADLGAGANQIAEGFIGGVRHVDAGGSAGAVKAGELIGIAAVGLDAVAGLAGNLGGGDENANVAVPVQAAGEGKPMRSGFVTTAQFGAWMRGLEFREEFEHVVMGAADDAVTPDLGGIRRRETDGDGIGVNIKTGEQDAVVGGRRRSSEDDGGGGPDGGFTARRAGGVFGVRRAWVGR